MVSDTTPEAKVRQREISSRMSGEEKLGLAMAWSDRVRDIAWAGFPHRHPYASEEELRAIFFKEIYCMDMEEFL